MIIFTLKYTQYNTQINQVNLTALIDRTAPSGLFFIPQGCIAVVVLTSDE